MVAPVGNNNDLSASAPQAKESNIAFVAESSEEMGQILLNPKNNVHSVKSDVAKLINNGLIRLPEGMTKEEALATVETEVRRAQNKGDNSPIYLEDIFDYQIDDNKLPRNIAKASDDSGNPFSRKVGTNEQKVGNKMKEYLANRLGAPTEIANKLSSKIDEGPGDLF